MIILTRFLVYPDRTIGRFQYGDKTWWSVERPWKDNKPNVSCIPEGRYDLVRVDSPKFGKNMWEVANVPNRTHILCPHIANTSSDLLGCVGIGKGVHPNLGGVGSSRIACEEFYAATEGLDREQIIITSGVLVA